jgi:hypothetical protein
MAMALKAELQGFGFRGEILAEQPLGDGTRRKPSFHALAIE